MTDAQKKATANFREKMKLAGFAQHAFWTTKEEDEKLRNYLKNLRRTTKESIETKENTK